MPSLEHFCQQFKKNFFFNQQTAAENWPANVRKFADQKRINRSPVRVSERKASKRERILKLNGELRK